MTRQKAIDLARQEVAEERRAEVETLREWGEAVARLSRDLERVRAERDEARAELERIGLTRGAK